MDCCTHTSPIKDIQLKKKRDFLCLGEHSKIKRKILPDSCHCLGKQKREITTGSYACIAPVGGHTCITAGERSEPAVVDYKRMNVSVPVGGPTATNGISPSIQMREKQHDELNNLW